MQLDDGVGTFVLGLLPMIGGILTHGLTPGGVAPAVATYAYHRRRHGTLA